MPTYAPPLPPTWPLLLLLTFYFSSSPTLSLKSHLTPPFLSSLSAMAIVRTSSQITNHKPPPSPIPTGKGSRSASNEPFTRFLNDSFRVPELALPPPRSPKPNDRRRIPAEVDLSSLVSSSGTGDYADEIRNSAKEFGVFRISGHWISVDELRSLLVEEKGEWDSRDSWKECCQVLRGNGNPKEEISWLSSSPNEPRELVLKRIGNQSYQELR